MSANRQCYVCQGEITQYKKYNNHVFALKNLAKKLLTYVGPMFPVLMGRFKKHWRRQNRIFAGDVAICGSCGHGYMVSPPNFEQLKEYYQGDYNEDVSRVITEEIEEDDYKTHPCPIAQVKFMRDYVDFSKFKSMLEIGAGRALPSRHLRYACNPDLALHVCEAGPDWERFYNENNIKRVAHYFPFESEQKFDFIYAHHWLEHVLDLNQTIQDLHNLVSDDGVVFMEVPNTGANYWQVNFPDIPHIHFFTEQSLVKSFENNGFRCLASGEFSLPIEDFIANGSVIPHNVDAYGPFENGVNVRAIFVKA